VLLIGIIKKWIKESISPRFGDLGVQLVLLSISIILAGAGIAVNLLPPEVLKMIGTIFSAAIVIYQVLYKAIFEKAILNKLDPGDDPAIKK
jgi:hypothetical protein